MPTTSVLIFSSLRDALELFSGVLSTESTQNISGRPDEESGSFEIGNDPGNHFTGPGNNPDEQFADPDNSTLTTIPDFDSSSAERLKLEFMIFIFPFCSSLRRFCSVI